jgi:DNA-binding transcriptional MerR regulator
MITTASPKANPAMPTEPPEAARRESWIDWFPNRPAILSAEALIAQAQARGIDCDLRTLRSWQTQKVLPLPAREGVAAVYPVEAVDFIAYVREMQGHGLRLEEIGARLRGRAKGASDRKLQNEFKRKLTEVASLQAELTGAPVKEMHVTFIDNDGLESTYTLAKPVPWRVRS